MTYTRDPLSERYDPAARQWLERAYKVKGEWSGQFLAPPGPLALAWCAVHGIDPFARDKWGEIRYVRAFKRSVYWWAKWYGGVDGLTRVRHSSPFASPVRIDWDTTGLVMRKGWAARRYSLQIRIVSAGKEAQAAGRKAKRRWITNNGEATQWASTIEDRDWNAAV